MRITPLDIRKQEFKKTMRGLDSDEVYAFLTTVAEEYETVLSDNKRLRERIVEIEDRLKEFKNMETNLRNTLLTAEKITAEAKENARKEAGLIVREAEVEAEKAAEAIRAHTQQLRREILELKKNKDNYITRLKTLLDSHQNVLTGFEDDFAEVDREIEMIGRKVDEDVKAAVKGTRMSRDRIEENDKVTWDDEQRREDIPRPSMPRPQHESGSTPKREASPEEDASATGQPGTQAVEQVKSGVEPEVIVDASQPVAETAEPARQPDLGLGENTEEDVSGLEEIARQEKMEDVRVDSVDVDAEHIVVADESDPGAKGHFNEGTVRREVSRSIESSMYPEAHINETGAAVGPQGPAAQGMTQDRQPQATATQQPSATMQQPEGQQRPEATQQSPEMKQPPASQENSRQESARPQGMVVTMDQPESQQTEAAQPRQGDDWKSYEVDEAKQDWSDYEVNAGEQGTPPQPQAEKVKEEPSDNEVEAALSGLEEFGEPAAQQPAAENVGQPAPQNEQPAQQAWQPPASQPAREGQPEQEQQPEGSDEQDGGSTWSMEELRKNLSNIDRDE